MFCEEDFDSVAHFGANSDWPPPAPAEADCCAETQAEVGSRSDPCPASEDACAADPQAVFFGLRQMPFGVSNPRPLLFAAREALKELAYGIRTRRGLLLLTGDAGTGKATLLCDLLDWLREEGTPVAFLAGPAPDTALLYDVMFREFGIGSRSKTNPPRLLRSWLSQRFEQGATAVLIVNEAQSLPLGVLEEICMLLNLETPCEKMLQIVLAGRPELEETLRQPELYSLRQRIALRCKLSPFSPEETNQYVEECLRMAGRESGAPIFSPEAMDAIHLYSRGLPHKIDSLCERALATSYAERIRPVSAAMIEIAAGEPPVEPGDAPDRFVKAGAAEYRVEAGARSLAVLSALLERAARVLESHASASNEEPEEPADVPIPAPATAPIDTGRIETGLDLGSFVAADSGLDEEPAVSVEPPRSSSSAPSANFAPPFAEESSQTSSAAFHREISRLKAVLNEAFPEAAPQDASPPSSARAASPQTAPAAVLLRRTVESIGQSLSAIARNPGMRTIATAFRRLRQPTASVGPSLRRLSAGWARMASRRIHSARVRSSIFHVRSSLSRLSAWLREPFDPVRWLQDPHNPMQRIVPRHLYLALRAPSHKKP
jgi:general secretion pathway protein A